MGIFQSIFAVILTAAMIVAFWRILPRAGLSPYWALVAIIPVGVPILLLVLAFRRWPGDPSGRMVR
ncbi:MAG: hypothetical protein AAF675_05530 [Pseudomonadota bacterium]